MKKYYPYKSDKDGKKFYIITNDNKKVYFGATGYEDFTTHKDETRKQRHISRHKKNEDWDGINSQPSGRDFIYGRNQPRKKHMKILKKY
jgi:hypothetical protein